MSALRKSLTGLSIIIMLFAVIAPRVWSQDTETPATATPVPTEEPFNFEKAYKDYIFTQSVYNNAHSEYQLARAQYMQAQTLAASSKAREATAAMLSARDDLMIVYITLIRQRLIESVGVDGSISQGLMTRLESEIVWYRNHKGKISSVATLDDLSKTSDEARKHYETTEPLIYETLATVSVGKVSSERKAFTDILNSLKQKTSSIRANGDLDTATAERWIIETDNKLTLSIDKENEAQALVATIASTDPRTRQSNRGLTYTQVVARLNESLAYLKEASGFTREVIKQLKTKQ